MTSNQWITTKKLAEIKNISERAVRKSIAKNKYVVRKIAKSYEVLVTTLEENVREKVTQSPEILHPLAEKCVEVPECEKRLALAKYELILKWNEYRRQNKKSKTGAGKEFLQMYNQKLLYENLFEIVGKVAIGTIYEWNRKLEINEDNWQILINDYTFGQKTIKTALKPIEENMFLKYLLNPNQYNIGKATKMTKYCLKERGMKDLSCDMTYRRFANNYKRLHFDTWTFAREGSKALKDKVVPYIPRDISMLEVGDVLIADGHRLAIQVINPFTGKPCRPTLIAYQDWKSGAMVGFEIMIEESTQAIASALRNSIINLGKIPQFCYQDNGKAFRANYFEGISGLFSNLGIQAVSAKAYNAKAKVIERFFRELQDSFERLLPSFVGANIDNKPAYMKRNEKWHKANHNNFIPTIEQTIIMLNKWLEFHYAQPCPNVKDKTIGEVFKSGKSEGVNLDRLDDLMMAVEIKTIGRNGIRFLKFDYYNENLYGLRDRVIIKHSLFDLSQIKVYTTKGKFICIAKRITLTNPLANYIGEPKDVEDLKQKLKQQKMLEKQTARKFIQELKQEKAFLPLLEDEDLFEDNTEKISEIKEVLNSNSNSNSTIFENKYQRYDWLLSQKKISDADKKWMKEYEKTTEYNQIYTESEVKYL